MLDFQRFAVDLDGTPSAALRKQRSVTRAGWPKKAFDLVVSFALLVPLTAACLLLVVLNPVFNAGPLVFKQTRMGLGCKPFAVIKFRTMTPGPTAKRGAFDLLETGRISSLGVFLRRTRIDELPQIINVLRGEMSLIGPRPDNYDHACVYLDAIPGYAARHRILPGISGFAQVEVGYVDGMNGMRRKIEADLFYCAQANFWLDLWITWRTVCVVVGRKGR